MAQLNIRDYLETDFELEVNEQISATERTYYGLGAEGFPGIIGPSAILSPAIQKRVSILSLPCGAGNISLRKNYAIKPQSDNVSGPYNDIQATVSMLKSKQNTIFLLNNQRVYYFAEKDEIWTPDRLLISGNTEILLTWFEHILKAIPEGYMLT